jgi:hypothetical protein
MLVGMIIAVKNHSKLADEDVLAAVRAVNRQIAEDFAPYWALSGALRVVDRRATPANADAVLRLTPRGHNFHWSPHGLPEAHVFTDLTEAAREAVPWLTWTSMLSHEAIEMMADPQLNTLVQGPHPGHAGRLVFHYQEVCDPVQSETYAIDGVTVSNFVLPHYYNSMGEPGGRNDFLSTGLQAFRWNENGMIGFWDPQVGKRGAYVTWPRYERNHLVTKQLRMKGASDRLQRYAHPRFGGRRLR